jgi:lambda repressor-like predicted transcriptional regulator
LASGISLRAVCREMDIPQSTMRYALRSDPEALAQTARARELGCDALADECIDISDDKTLDPADRRVRIETRLKLLGKWSQRYADKQSHEHSGPDGAPLQIAYADVAGLARSLRDAAAGRADPAALAPAAAPKALPKGSDLL